MKFPGASFCDGKQKLMMIATLPLSIRKVFLKRVHKKLDSMPFIWKKVKKISIFVKILQSFTQEMWDEIGTANDTQMRTSFLPYMLCGHEIHHRNTIEEKYIGK